MNDTDYINILSKYLNYKALEIDKPINKETFERELEVRFSLDYSTEDVLKKLNNTQKFEITYEKSIVKYYKNNKRKIIYIEPKSSDIIQDKKDISYDTIILQGYPVKIAFSHEITKSLEQEKDFEDYIEEKERDRYIIKNFLGDQDLHLTRSFYKKKNEIINNIEIEYNLSKLKNIKQIIEPIKYIFDLMYVKSIELLTPSNMTYIISIFNDYLARLKQRITKKDETDIYKNKLINYEDKPIPLPVDKIIDIKTDKYFVTNKLNGTRYFLFIIGGDFFLIGKTGSKISKIPTNVWKIFKSDKIDKRQIFILDGEYFDSLDNNKLYYAFDILLHVNIYLNSAPYYDRLNWLKKITDYLYNISPVQMKYIVPSTDTNSVIKYMKDIFKDEWNYDNDGLIFTLKDSIYANNLYKTYKWKFLHHQSVDVYIKSIPDVKNYYECYIGDDDSPPENLKKFSNYPLYTNEKLADGNIVEVAFDDKLKEFYMLRLRPDKEKPNYKTVGESFWNDITNEVELSSISKKELFIKNSDDWKNFRKRSNIEKENLIKTISPGSEYMVIDIGFGKGGDILKYARQGIENIIGIEPDIENIKDFCDRYSLEKSNETVTIYNDIKIEDKLNRKIYNISVTLINKSASDSENIELLNKFVNEIPKKIIVCAFFSLTYFFNPLDDFVKLFYNMSQIHPEKIIGTVMDGEKTEQFLENYYWNSKSCGLDLKLIKNINLDNKIFIKIAGSETVRGHYEYLFNFYRLKEYLSWYNYKLLKHDFFNNNLGDSNLITYFASIYSSFIFMSSEPTINKRIKNINVQRRLSHYYKTNKLIIEYNNKLGLPLDCQYLYNSFISIKQKDNLDISNINKIINNFLKNKNIEKYSIEKNLFINDDNGDEKIEFKFLKKEVEYNVLDTLRYFLLSNNINKYYKLFYEVAINNTIKEKIFYGDIKPYKISNYFYDYYKTHDNDSIEFFNLLKDQLSPLKKYDLYEFNSGIGNLTMIFGKFFNNVNVFESDILHFQISKTNVSIYNNTKQINNCLNIDKNNKINNINFYNNILLENIKTQKNNILFINYQLKNEPYLEEIKTFFKGKIIILTPNILLEMDDNYYNKYYRYKLQNNYVYFINDNLDIINDLEKKDIKYLISNPLYKEKTIDLILKNLHFSKIDKKEIIDIIDNYHNDNEILFELNKLKFEKSKYIKPDENKIDVDIIRGGARLKEIIQLFNKNNIKLNINKSSKYIDIGSGNGVITKKIGESLGFSFKNIYGVEISKWMEKDHKDNKTAVSTAYITGNTLPFDDNYFELVTCIMSIHHFEHKNEMLNEIKRVLKPNGILLIREHEYDHTKEMKDLIDLEHALYATVINEKMNNINQINDFWKTYIGDYFSFEDLKKDLEKLNIISLNNIINLKGPTNYYWSVFKNADDVKVTNIEYYFNDKNNTIDLSKLKFTTESIYSVTPWKESKIISDKIEQFFNTNKITITDATSNVGGNTIGFLEAGFNVNSVEIDEITCDYLKNNILVYNYTTSQVYCKNYLDIYKDLKQNVIFFDPPWGGTDYAKNKVLDLFLGDVNIIDLIKSIFDINLTELVVLKAPNNFNEEKMFDILDEYNIEKITIYRKDRISYVIYYISKKIDDIIKQSKKFKGEETEFIQKNYDRNIDHSFIVDDMLYKYRENKIKKLGKIKNPKEREFMIKSYYYIDWQKAKKS